MEQFLESYKLSKLVFLKIPKYYQVDDLCASVLCKIYLSLKYNVKVKIVAPNFSGSEIFFVDSEPINLQATILKFNAFKQEIKIDQEIIKISSINLTDYFYKLLVKENYVIDYEIIGFYTLLSYKLSLLYLEHDQQKQIFLRLLQIMNDEQFYTLEYNVEQIVKQIDKYVV